MANRIIAVDLGAWSVKVAIAQPGLRHATLTAFVERVIPEGEASWEDRASEVLAQIVREQRIDHDSVYLGVPGDHVFTHVLEFAFKNLRRSDLEKAVGAELEGVVPLELEDMVYTFEALPSERTEIGAPADAEPAIAQVGRMAAPTVGMRVLTYAMARQRAESWLELAERAGAPARSLFPEAGPIARLVERAPSLAGVRAQGPLAVVDIGHTRTDIVVVRGGRPVYTRTLQRGGKAVTDAIARHWQLPTAEAERAKHSDGFIASSAEPAESEAWARVSEIVTAELAPLARELRQTFAACRARAGASVGYVVLVGGGARLRGVTSYLTEQLGLPVGRLPDADGDTLASARLGAVTVDTAALCLGIIADAETGRPLFDLRQGSLAAKVDLSFLRAKAPTLAAAVIAMAGCITLSGWAAHYKLRKAEKVLVERLAVESTEEFGEPQTADQILGTASTAAPGAVNPLPKLTAWDILLDINERMPPRDKITLDIDSIEIDAQKVQLKGTANTPDEVDAIEAALKGQPCFTEVTRGALQTVAEDKRQFEFSIKAACM